MRIKLPEYPLDASNFSEVTVLMRLFSYTHKALYKIPNPCP